MRPEHASLLGRARGICQNTADNSSARVNRLYKKDQLVTRFRADNQRVLVELIRFVRRARDLGFQPLCLVLVLPLPIRVGLSMAGVGLVLLLGTLLHERWNERGQDRALREEEEL